MSCDIPNPVRSKPGETGDVIQAAFDFISNTESETCGDDGHDEDNVEKKNNRYPAKVKKAKAAK